MSYLPDDGSARRRSLRHIQRARTSMPPGRPRPPNGSPPGPPTLPPGPPTSPPGTPTSPPGPPSRTATRQQRPIGLGRFFGLTTLGTVLPGAGLLLSGRRKSGGLLLFVFVLAVVGVAGLLYWFGPRNSALYVAVRPRLVQVLVVGVAAAVVLIATSVVATGWINRARPSHAGKNLLMSMFVGLMCALLIAPTVLAGRYALMSRDAITKIFDVSSLKPRDAGRSAELARPDALANIPTITVLLLGTDAYPNRPGIRTDSMMVASIDTATGNTTLFGIPRNLNGWQIRKSSPVSKLFPYGTRCGADCWLTNYWRTVSDYVTAHPAEFQQQRPQDVALDELSNVIDDFLGIPIDNTVIVDIRGFSELVDAMGGVDITVKERLPKGGKLNDAGQIIPGSITGWIEPGRQHMDGYTAMWYSRSRVTTDDFSRMRRQRCMMAALARQVNPTTLLTKLPAILRVAQNNIATDIDMSQLALWSELATRVQRGKIRSLPFTHRIFDNTNPNYEWVHAYVAHAIDPDANPLPATDGRGQPWPTPTPTPTGPTKSPRPTTPGPSTSTTDTEGVVDVDEAC